MLDRIAIVSAVRTPIGKFMGALSSVSAVEMGAIAVQQALTAIDLDPNMVEELLMGQVIQANSGQSPAKQVAIQAGLSSKTICTTVNKVCASGMKSILIAAQTIETNQVEIVVAGGMESMSNAPHYTNIRTGVKFGSSPMIDSLQKDGLSDAFSQQAMGVFADLCAEKHQISREQQDQYAIHSYLKSNKAWELDQFKDEIVAVKITNHKGIETEVAVDEEFTNVIIDKIPNLRPAFTKDGTATAANSSTINDGAAALVLMKESKAKSLGIKPLAFVHGFAEASQDPEWFTTTPAIAIQKALQKTNLSIDDIDFFEINEAFSVVALANIKLLNLNPNQVNIHGGAVALGHPLGCSGTRIVVSLIHILNQNKAKYGVAAICNGGGGASAIVIENNL